MFSVRAEHEPEKITLVNVLAKALVGIVGKLIRLQIEHRNRLRRLRLLRSIPVIQQRGVTPLPTHRNGCGKAIAAAYAARRRDRQCLARGQRYRWSIGLTLLSCRNLQSKKYNHKPDAGKSNHSASAIFDLRQQNSKDKRIKD